MSGLKRMFRSESLGLLVVLALLVVLFGGLSDRFLTPRTFTTVANQMPDLAVIAVGMTFVPIVAESTCPSARSSLSRERF